MKMLIPFLVTRTKMAGCTGTSYDVYVRTRYKKYRPIAFSAYATVVVLDGKEYYRLDDFLRTPEIDALDVSNARAQAFHHLRAVAERLEIRIAKRAFTELAGLDRLPLLWANWNETSATRIVKVRLHRHAHLCS